jgi:hypothetical protein
MQRINVLCFGDSNQPMTHTSALRAALERKKSLIDFRLADITNAKRALGMDSVHAQKLDGLVDGWREVEKATNAELEALENGTDTGNRHWQRHGHSHGLPHSHQAHWHWPEQELLRSTLPVADQMIALIKLAFEWDLTRVVALTMSGASSGHRWPGKGVDKAHHSLEHGDDVEGRTKRVLLLDGARWLACVGPRRRSTARTIMSRRVRKGTPKRPGRT